MNTPKIFLVEDDLHTQSDIVAALEKLPLSGRQLYGIEGVSIKTAESARAAKELLEEAARNGEPYDILLLDLAIPYDEENNVSHPQNGLDLLSSVNKAGAAKEIIIYTEHPRFKYALQALRGGVVDFIDKSLCEPDELLPYILSVWGRLLDKESKKLLGERAKELVPYAEKGLAHRFSVCFSSFAQSVAHVAEGIEHYAGERLGLDLERDAQNPLVRSLRSHREAIKTAMQEWTRLQNDLSAPGEKPHVHNVEQLLREIQEKVRPCLIVKKVELQLRRDQTYRADRELNVLTFESYTRAFQNDVRAVLEEIIIGALSELPDYGEPRKIDVTFGLKDERVEVRFVDDGETIDERDARSINEGFTIMPDEHFGREWGLSVAQHVALRGGGRLIVESQAPRRGNRISYLIPLAHHA